jgi:hypothetical protein
MADICISKTFQKNSNNFKINKLKRERQEKYLECERERWKKTKRAQNFTHKLPKRKIVWGRME